MTYKFEIKGNEYYINNEKVIDIMKFPIKVRKEFESFKAKTKIVKIKSIVLNI